jgi:hypothetical protein
MHALAIALAVAGRRSLGLGRIEIDGTRMLGR